MSLVTTNNLVDLLSRSPLLSMTQQGELVRDLQVRAPDARALARQLLERGWLTSFQLNQLFQGRGGDLILGPYVLLERIGEGGTGRVYKARHSHMNRIVALKVIRPELLSDREVVTRFRREVQVASQMTDPNVVHAYDAGEVGGTYFLATEYVEGVDLAQLVEQHGPLPVEQATEFLRQAALGLQHIHEHGLVHRDIKPSNLLVSGGVVNGTERTASMPRTPPRGYTSPRQIKILDLGLARLQRPLDGDATGKVTGAVVTMGTLDYMAPEQAIDFRNVDHRADIYSLGCTFYHALEGRPPFPGGSVAQKLMRHQQSEAPALRRAPPGLAAAINQMMAKRPEDRFQSALAIVQALPVPTATLLPAVVPAAAVVSATGLVPTQPGRFSNLLPRPWQALPARLPGLPRGRRWLPLAAAVGLLAALLLLTTVGYTLLSRAGNRPTYSASPTWPTDGNTVFLSDLPEVKPKVHWMAKFGKDGDLGVHNRRIMLQGVPAPKGLGVHPPERDASSVSYRLDKQFQLFKTTATLNDSSTRSASPLIFVVLGDGRPLWQSKPIQVRGDQQECVVRVSGVDVLELVVTCAGANDGAHAVWIDPQLMR
ncbi:MAG: protein kinase [Planctomycetia bacterium]|nr:protein kinase [Planctomycetia bacterium]